MKDTLEKFLIGIADLILTMAITPEEILFGDYPEMVGFNFKTDVHEYTVSLDHSLDSDDNNLSLVVWHGSGTGDIAEGPVNEETWKAIKSAISKEDRQCEFCGKAPLKVAK